MHIFSQQTDCLMLIFPYLLQRRGCEPSLDSLDFYSLDRKIKENMKRIRAEY